MFRQYPIDFCFICKKIEGDSLRHLRHVPINKIMNTIIVNIYNLTNYLFKVIIKVNYAWCLCLPTSMIILPHTITE